MRWQPVILLAALAANAATAQTPLWQDEFDGTTLGPDWEPMLGDGTSVGLPSGWGNNELQWYTDRPQNLYVADGLLHIVARRENFAGAQYTSARLRTQNRQEFLYGRIEARIKVPTGQGMWPAFWMMPTSSPYGGWAAGGEVDIMETKNETTVVHGTIHYGGEWPRNTYTGGTWVPGGVNLADDFHVYAIEWEPGVIRWYFDGNLYNTETAAIWYTEAENPPATAPFDHPFHLLLNVAVGGNFPGDVGPDTVFPQEMQVDWVRVYALEREPFLGQPHAIPGVIEAEDYDRGLEGQTYHDCDIDNHGRAYRPWDGVDIEPSSEGGFNVGWMCPSEWLEYTADVQQAGAYRIDVRTASQTTGGAFRLLFDGLDLTDLVTIPSTGGWQNWRTDSVTVRLPAGQQIMRFENSAEPGEYNLNHFTFTRLGAYSDWDLDGVTDVFDLLAYLDLWFNGAVAAQLALGPEIDVFDLLQFLDCWFAPTACE